MGRGHFTPSWVESVPLRGWKHCWCWKKKPFIILFTLAAVNLFEYLLFWKHSLKKGWDRCPTSDEEVPLFQDIGISSPEEVKHCDLPKIGAHSPVIILRLAVDSSAAATSGTDDHSSYQLPLQLRLWTWPGFVSPTFARMHMIFFRRWELKTSRTGTSRSSVYAHWNI